MNPATATPPVEAPGPAPASAPEKTRSRLGSPIFLGFGGLAAVALSIAALALLAPGAGSGVAADSGPLVWTSPPRLYVAPGNPSDRILTGTIRNDSVRVAEIEARDVQVIAEDGERLKSAAIFLGSFSRGLYAASRRERASDIEQRRTGRLLRIGPGTEQPLTVSWRLRGSGDRGARVDYGLGSLGVGR